MMGRNRCKLPLLLVPGPNPNLKILMPGPDRYLNILRPSPNRQLRLELILGIGFLSLSTMQPGTSPFTGRLEQRSAGRRP